MNTFALVGRLGKDPELKMVGDLAISEFSLAENYFHKGEQKTQWWNCAAYGHTADRITKNAKKGYLLSVSGELREEKYVNKEGINITAYKYVVDKFTFVNGGEKPTERRPFPDNAKPYDKSFAKNPEDMPQPAYQPPPVSTIKDDIPF